MSIIIKFEDDFYKNLSKFKEKNISENKKHYFYQKRPYRNKIKKSPILYDPSKEDTIKILNDLENTLKNEFDKRIKYLEGHYKAYEDQMNDIKAQNQIIFDDLYGTETQIEHSSLKKIKTECGEVQKNILEYYKNTSPENMNLLVNELEVYKECMRKI